LRGRNTEDFRKLILVQARRFLNIKEEYDEISQPQKWDCLKHIHNEALERKQQGEPEVKETKRKKTSKME